MLALTQLTALAWPAHACGCGAMVTADGSELLVTEETSVVVWDGDGTQQIVMRLTVDGDAAAAAWVMPVPGRAEVTLAEPELFTELDAVVAPERRVDRYFWPRPGDWPRAEQDTAGSSEGSAPPVEVVSQDRLGPFDVSRLAAGDPAALARWLENHGFALSGSLAGALEPYVAAGWEYVAVRLAPEGEAGGRGPVLSGPLEPLRLTFATERPVYPMRLSRLADTQQFLRLFVLADHRTTTEGTIGGDPVDVVFAGRLTPDELPRGALRQLVGEGRFLTLLHQDFPDPGRIDGDHHLVKAGSDEEFRRVESREELLTWGPVPAWQPVVGAPVALAVVAAFAVARVRRRRSETRPGAATGAQGEPG
ncbi:DUF2330 domain-containing protein [Streptomyces sp. ventii]|uniref:DUF2330 domain-containing protein n=1 Tax=Streptomyces spiramenti TaxID=2720606 RepID=A0ABX1AH61_9ACTN|nr:DUF2330 domain-containing protein [Streptomyces spiramenti]